MTQYIDGFVVPIPKKCLEKYQQVVQSVAEIWKQHGALDYREYVGDDMTLEGTGSFLDMVSAKENEVVVFGWVVFASRESRDAVNEKVSSDPRMAELINAADIGFDAQRMAYGGFRQLVD